MLRNPLPTCLFSLFLLATAIHAAAPDQIVVLMSVDGLAHYYLDDPQAEMPNIRRLAQEGARAVRMKAVMPSVTWPNHTTLVTGVTPAKHGVVGNTYWDREHKKVEVLIWDNDLDKEQLIQSPTIYDVAKQAGLTTAAVTWPGSRSARNLDWTVPCTNDSEIFVRCSTPSLLPEFQAASIPYASEADGFKDGHGQDRDRLHVRMFNHILRAHHPRLALLHVLEVDHVEHSFGPQSPEAYAAVKFADGLVGEVWETLQKTFPGKATLVVVSDHGFFAFHQWVRPNVVLQKAGLLTTVGSKITNARVRAVSQGGASLIYIEPGADHDALTGQVKKLFQETEGVALALEPKDFPAYGLADPAKQPRAPDVVISAKEGFSFDDLPVGEIVSPLPGGAVKGSHGFDPNEPRMHATFVAWGVGIKAGSNAGVINNTSVAPTLAALLGIEMPNVDGPILTDILALGSKP